MYITDRSHFVLGFVLFLYCYLGQNYLVKEILIVNQNIPVKIKKYKNVISYFVSKHVLLFYSVSTDTVLWVVILMLRRRFHLKPGAGWYTLPDWFGSHMWQDVVLYFGKSNIARLFALFRSLCLSDVP